MNLLYVMMLSVGLALYVFSTISKLGATQATIGKKKIVGIGVLYSIIMIVLVGIGILISYLIEYIYPIQSVKKITRGIVIALLVIIVYRLLMEAFSRKTFLEKRAEQLTNKTCILLALQSSFEAIVVGICVFESNSNALIDLVVVIIFTLIASVYGFLHGYFNGTKGNKGVVISSASLLFISAIILL